MFSRTRKMFVEIEKIQTEKETNENLLPRNNVQSSFEKYVFRLLQCKLIVRFFFIQPLLGVSN